MGVTLLLLAVGGSAIGVVGWHLLSNRNPGIDTAGFDMSTTPDRPSFPGSATSAVEPEFQTSLGMVKGGAGISVAGSGSSTPRPSGSAGAASPKEDAALTFKDAASKYENLVSRFVRRMEAKHPSITRYGRDWAASPELRALRDQYWKDKDPIKFAYGITRSNDFGKLVNKYGRDPGIRDALLTGVRESPPSLMAAAGGVMKSDRIAKDLVMTILKAAGLPASMAGMVDGSDTKPPDKNQILADVMKSDDMKKAMQLRQQQSPVPLDQNAADTATDAATSNGFTPLGGRR